MTRIKVSASTDAGAVRSANEDSFVAREPLFLVADGMGGHERGDVASRTAISVLDEAFPPGSEPTPEQVVEAIALANARVRDISSEGESIAGTTLTGVVLVRFADSADADQRYWMVINVGDSRVYQWDGRDLTQLTVDHSAVQELVDAGQLDAEQARLHPDRNIITRALGAADLVETDVWLVPARGKQLFLVCSDGITTELADEHIARILAAPLCLPASDESLAAELVDAALAVGGRDNATAIVVESQAGPSRAESHDATHDRGGSAFRILEETRPRG